MTASNLIALLPLILLAAGALVIMLLIAFHSSHAAAAGVALVIFILALISIPVSMSQSTGPVTPLLLLDGYAYLIIGLILVTGILITLLTYS